MPFTIDDLNYDKDSKERMPWEHYLELYAKADPKEIASRLSIPYDEEAKEFTLTSWALNIRSHIRISR